MASAIRPLISTYGRRLTVAGLGGLLVGILTSIGQGALPDLLSPVANSAGAWCLAAFALALTDREPRRAALLGALALAAMLAGYAVATALDGNVLSTRANVFWGAAAVVVGPVLGVGAAWLRGSSPVLAGLGISPIAGILIGEGIYGLTVIADTTPAAYWAAQMVVGSLLLIAVAAHLRVLRAIVLMCAATAVVAAAFYVVYSGNLLSLLP